MSGDPLRMKDNVSSDYNDPEDDDYEKGSKGESARGDREEHTEEKEYESLLTFPVVESREWGRTRRQLALEADSFRGSKQARDEFHAFNQTLFNTETACYKTNENGLDFIWLTHDPNTEFLGRFDRAHEWIKKHQSHQVLINGIRSGHFQFEETDSVHVWHAFLMDHERDVLLARAKGSSGIIELVDVNSHIPIRRPKGKVKKTDLPTPLPPSDPRGRVIVSLVIDTLRQHLVQYPLFRNPSLDSHYGIDIFPTGTVALQNAAQLSGCIVYSRSGLASGSRVFTHLYFSSAPSDQSSDFLQPQPIFSFTLPKESRQHELLAFSESYNTMQLTVFPKRQRFHQFIKTESDGKTLKSSKPKSEPYKSGFNTPYHSHLPRLISEWRESTSADCARLLQMQRFARYHVMCFVPIEQPIVHLRASEPLSLVNRPYLLSMLDMVDYSTQVAHAMGRFKIKQPNPNSWHSTHLPAMDDDDRLALEIKTSTFLANKFQLGTSSDSTLPTDEDLVQPSSVTLSVLNAKGNMISAKRGLSSRREWWIVSDSMNAFHVFALVQVEVITDIGNYIQNVYADPHFWDLPRLDQCLNTIHKRPSEDLVLWNTSNARAKRFGELLSNHYQAPIVSIDSAKSVATAMENADGNQRYSMDRQVTMGIFRHLKTKLGPKEWIHDSLHGFYLAAIQPGVALEQTASYNFGS